MTKARNETVSRLVWRTAEAQRRGARRTDDRSCHEGSQREEELAPAAVVIGLVAVRERGEEAGEQRVSRIKRGNKLGRLAVSQKEFVRHELDERREDEHTSGDGVEDTCVQPKQILGQRSEIRLGTRAKRAANSPEATDAFPELIEMVVLAPSPIAIPRGVMTE